MEILRGEPHFAKRLSDPLPESNRAKKARLLVASEEASRIVGPEPSQLECVNGKVVKLPLDPYGEYCREMRSERTVGIS